MPEPFGSFGWICQHTPLPQCNLFFSQLYNANHNLTTLFPSSGFFDQYNVTSLSVTDDTNVMAARSDAGTGVGATCEIARVGHRGSKGDAALIALSAVSLLFAAGLAAHATRRRAAVGRVELRALIVLYGILCAFQLIDMTSILEQGSKGLVIVSSIHIAFFVTAFWVLLGNAIIATQVVEDGTPAAVVPLSIVSLLFFAPTLYISLAVGFNWNSSAFAVSASDPTNLRSTALFVLSLIWPAAASVIYIVLMLFITLGTLREPKPAAYLSLAFCLFSGSQIVFFVASHPLCESSGGKINGAFLSTFLNSCALGLIYLAWTTITEEEWGDDQFDMWS